MEHKDAMNLPPGPKVTMTRTIIDDHCDGCGDDGYGHAGILFTVQDVFILAVCRYCLNRALAALPPLPTPAEPPPVP